MLALLAATAAAAVGTTEAGASSVPSANARRVRRFQRRAASLLSILTAGVLLPGAAAIASMPSLAIPVLHNAGVASLVATLAYLAARNE